MLDVLKSIWYFIVEYRETIGIMASILITAYAIHDTHKANVYTRMTTRGNIVMLEVGNSGDKPIQCKIKISTNMNDFITKEICGKYMDFSFGPKQSSCLMLGTPATLNFKDTSKDTLDVELELRYKGLMRVRPKHIKLSVNGQQLASAWSVEDSLAKIAGTIESIHKDTKTVLDFAFKLSGRKIANIDITKDNKVYKMYGRNIIVLGSGATSEFIRYTKLHEVFSFAAPYSKSVPTILLEGEILDELVNDESLEIFIEEYPGERFGTSDKFFRSSYKIKGYFEKIRTGYYIIVVRELLEKDEDVIVTDEEYTYIKSMKNARRLCAVHKTVKKSEKKKHGDAAIEIDEELARAHENAEYRSNTKVK